MVHQETRSKKIIDTLDAAGHCVSYKDIIRLRNTLAQEEIDRYIVNDNTIIPKQLVPNRFVQFAADNIDILEETLDKSPTFHGTQMVAFQKGPPNHDVCHEIELLPYKTKLDIPESFHLRRTINCNKSTNPIPLVKNKENLISYTGQVNYICQHNMAWILCRLLNKEEIVVPQWSGFNKFLAEEHDDTTMYGYLPLLPYVASEYDTVWTTMKRCESIAKKLNVRYTVLTFDQAIYFKAKEIQWLKHEECDQFIFRLSGFHIMLNFVKVIGHYMENSGLKDIWLESDLYGEATIMGIFSGKKWNKAVRAHKLTYESAMRIIVSTFQKWLVDCGSNSLQSFNVAQLLASQLRTYIKANRSLHNFQLLLDTCEELSDAFIEFINSQSSTFKLWYSYVRLVEILLEFLYSGRTGNWDLHLSSFRKMLPWFFAYDHTNYSRWGTIYLLDMLNLPDTAPDVKAEFDSGNFVVRRLSGKFNTISVDQALEHVNKSAKDAGGIVGLTKNSTRLDEWFLSYNDIGVMVDSFKSSLNPVHLKVVNQNIEVGTQRIILDEESVVKLEEQFNRFHVFSREDQHLVCVSTDEIIDDNIAQTLLNACEIGEGTLRDFVNTIDSKDFYKSLKKQNLQKLVISKKQIKKTALTNESQGGQKFLQQVLAAKEMGRDIKHSTIFKYELTPHPMALASNGILSTPSNKSSLGNIIETLAPVVKGLPETDKTSCYIVDAMSVVQALGKPARAKTFKDYAQIYNSIIFRNKYNCKRIDVVFDHYLEQSIKNCTRLKRGLESGIKRIISAPNTTLPQQWHLFIHSIHNKSQLTHFLSNALFEYLDHHKFELVTSGGFADILEYRTNFELTDNYLSSNHEEADTRILLHILSAKKAGYERCIIDCKDTDVLVLLTHFKDHLTPEVWMKVGTHDSIRFIPVHQINLDLNLVKHLPAFHAITGCDTVSQFSGLGKKSCWKVFLTHFKLLDGVGVDHFTDKLFSHMHKFVLKLYTNNDNIVSIDDLRAILAVSKTIDKLPPTENSLRQHCLRAHYQTKVWLNSLDPQSLLPSILDHGWTTNDKNEILPVFQTQPPVPNDNDILINCHCKKDCSSKICSCRKKNVLCIGSCLCMGQKSCKNSSLRKQQTESRTELLIENSDSD